MNLKNISPKLYAGVAILGLWTTAYLAAKETPKAMRLIEEATAHLNNVRVTSFSSLITDFMVQQDAHIIVRGVRSVKDLEYEENEAYMIKHLKPEIDTVFLLTRPDLSYVSSSGVREVFRFGGSVHGLVPACVEQAMQDKKEK